MVQHRALARYILELSEDCLVIGDDRLTLPEGMSHAEYEEIAIKQIKEYVSKEVTRGADLLVRLAVPFS